MKKYLLASVAVAAALVVAGCGGDSDVSVPVTSSSFDSLVSFGDSLSDVGSFKVGTIAQLTAQAGGGRWVTSSPAGGEIWIERLSVTLNLPKPCAAQTGMFPNIPGITGAPIVVNTNCRAYGQGSSRVTNPAGPNSVALQAAGQVNLGLTAKPVKDQMAAHLAAVNGKYSGRELVTVMAGGNDVFMELGAVGAGLQTPAQALTNMGAAGTTLGQLIKSEVLGKGAAYVLVLNVPSISDTPLGRTFDANTRALVDGMVTTFNSQLASQLTGVAGIKQADAYAESKKQAANPAAFGFTNVTVPACGINALSSPATAPGTALVCNGTNLIAGDVSRYQFADDVHPSAYGHQVLANFAYDQLLTANWR
jgi:outer membrane lipase/esterase